MNKNKFDFGIDFQQLILQYTLTDRIRGAKVLGLYDDTYFTLIPHAIIAYLLKRFYKKRKRLPSEIILRENLRTYYKSAKGNYSIEDEDKKNIDNIITTIYSSPVPDGDEVLEKCRNFARYVNFKREMENVDINNYESYNAYADKLKKAQNIGSNLDEDNGIYLIAGAQERIMNRDKGQVVYPTPFWQFNRLLNSGGTTRGNIIMLVSQAKRFKTGSLINVGVGYMRLRKKVLYCDFENGQDTIATRTDQSLIGAPQKEILAGKMDKDLRKLIKRYRKIGAELVIKRFTAYRDSAEDVRAYMREQNLKFGIEFNVIIADYLDLSGTTSGIEDDTKRIDTAYVEWKSMADQENIEALWTASHVVREAAKRRGTKYDQNDLAKCIDKIRHCDAAIGIQENEAEIEAKVHRWEIIDQRNGGLGSMMFWVDIDKQKLKEFSKQEAYEYRSQTSDYSDIKKKPKKSDL